MIIIELTVRQKTIFDIVKKYGPITGREIAVRLALSRAALRFDLSILIMAGLLGAKPKVGYYITGKEPSDIIAGALGNIKVLEVHSCPVVVTENTNISNAIITMFLEDVGSLFVVSDGGFLEGIVSRKDMLKITMGGEELQHLPVGLIMTRMPNIVVTFPEETVARAANKLITHQIDSLPVINLINVDGKNKFQVTGRLTKTNITKLFVHLSQ